MRKMLPLTGAYNTRPGTYALTGASSLAGLAIAGLAIAGTTGAASNKDHRLINCSQITVSDTNSQSKRLYVAKRPGFAVGSTPAAGVVGNALLVWTGQGSGTKIMSAFGATNFTLYDSTTSKGTGTGKATGITETSISGTPTLFISSSDSTGWTYQDGGSATKITDGDFPGNAGRTLAGTFAHLDGYPFIMDSVGRIYNGDLNSLTSWTANSYLTANSTPDGGIGVMRCGDAIVGFCRTHFDSFRNAGNPTGSVLARIEGAGFTQKYGAVSADAITAFKDAIVFAGVSDGSNIGIYIYNLGVPVKKVSPPELDALLSVAGASSIYLTTLGYFGRNFIVCIAASSTFVYCVEEDNWHEWTGYEQLWHKASSLKSGSTIANYTISKTSTSGKVYVVNPSAIVNRDDGQVYAASIQTTKWDAGSGNKKTCKRIRVIGDQQTAASTLYIAWSDDDYQTSITPRAVDLSDARPNLARCGRFVRRSFILSHNANTEMRLEALEMDFEEDDT